MITISDLWLYPVKSLRGFQIPSATLTLQGLQWDRHWMLIDENGKFLTQRKIPQMVLVNTRLTDSELILSKQGIDDCHIPLAPPTNSESQIASIWKDSCEVIIEDATVNRWLQKALDWEKPIYLVRMKAGTQRTQSKGEQLGDDTHTYFADAAPFLITNVASLNALNQSLQAHKMTQASMEQFRPNIVLEGLAPFAEHTIGTLKHNQYELKHCYPCQRCIMPTIDLGTAIPHPKQEPFKRLMHLNTMPDNNKAPAFGENAILTKGAGLQIQLGDTLVM